MASAITEVSSNKSFGGYQKVFSHYSPLLKCQMKFAIYLPPQAEDGKCPLLYFLSGLTCTEQNFIQKAGAQRFASQHGFVVVAPDTSPRGCNIPGEEEKWNVGTGASLYVDATQEPWSQHYQMYSYIVSELPAIIEEHFPVLPDSCGIFGHSMGGHGALLCTLLNPGKYKSVSAFAPVCDSVKCVPFQEALSLYLGEDVHEQNKWSATELARKYQGPPLHILIDQGTDDEFLQDLRPEEFTKACTESRISVVLNMRQGYDHGYYFVSSYIEDHFVHHAKFLK